MGERKLPAWVKGTTREFKQRKRREVRAAIKAVEVLLIGSAYAPTKNIGLVLNALREMKRAMSVKEWRGDAD